MLVVFVNAWRVKRGKKKCFAVAFRKNGYEIYRTRESDPRSRDSSYEGCYCRHVYNKARTRTKGRGQRVREDKPFKGRTLWPEDDVIRQQPDEGARLLEDVKRMCPYGLEDYMPKGFVLTRGMGIR